MLSPYTTKWFCLELTFSFSCCHHFIRMSVSQGPNFSRVWNGFASWKLWAHLSGDQQFTDIDIDPECIKWTSMHLHPFQECQISAGLKNYIQKIRTTLKSNIWKYCLLLKTNTKITKLFTDIMAKQCNCCKFIHQNYPWHGWDHQWLKLFGECEEASGRQTGRFRAICGAMRLQVF